MEQAESGAQDDTGVAKTVDLDANGDQTAQAGAGGDGVRYVSGSAAVPVRRDRGKPGWDAPTLSGPHYPGGSYDEPAYHDPYGRRRGRSHRARWWVIAAVTLVVLAGAVGVLFHFRSDQSPEAQVARKYFTALAEGDTRSALALVDDSASYTGSEYPLLASAALVKPEDRPSEATVVKSVRTTVDGGRAARVVTVAYSIDGTPVRQDLTLIETGGEYRLKAPFITVAVSGARGRSVQVNGIDYPHGAAQAVAFPGGYHASVKGDRLIAPATARATYSDSSGAVKADVWIPAPTLATGADAAIQSAVNHALDACAQSTSPTPNGCPFRYSDTSATMKWSITQHPKVKAKVGADGTVTFDDGGHSAVVHYEATTSGFFGLFSRTKTGDMDVTITGSASISDGGVAVKLG